VGTIAIAGPERREIEAIPDYDDGRLAIRPERFLVYAHGEMLELTVREFSLLVELRRHSGHTRTREQLIAAVWGPDEAVSNRAVDVHVKRLRDKLEAAIPDATYIQTTWGRGYGFDCQLAAEWVDD